MITTFFQVLRAALSALRQVDMHDMHYMYASKRFNVSIFPPSFYCGKQGMPRRLGVYFYHFLRHALALFDRVRVRIEPNSLLLYVASLNQAKSVLPLVKKLNRGYGLGEYVKDTERFPFFLAYLIGLVFFPWSFIRLFKSVGYVRESYGYILDSYLLFPGYFIMSHFWLRAKRPSVLVLANDHSMQPRTLRYVAMQQGIKTVYLQHASVMERFPALEFDYALLDGMAALRAYDAAGPSKSKVFLIGMAMADSFVHKDNSRKGVQAIGLCVGSLDSLERAEELCLVLRKRFPELAILLRPHPAEAHSRLRGWKALRDKFRLQFSDSHVEGSFDYLSKCDAIIAGDSGIHLEAALLNVMPLYFDFPRLKLDFYGFQRHGLLSYCEDPGLLCDNIQRIMSHRPDARSLTKPFCATVQTPYFGLSGQLSSFLMAQVADHGCISLNGWQRIHGLKHLEAYEWDGEKDLLAGANSMMEKLKRKGTHF